MQKKNLNTLLTAFALVLFMASGCNQRSNTKSSTEKDTEVPQSGVIDERSLQKDETVKKEAAPKKQNKNLLKDMVLFEGGEITIGNNEGYYTEKPEFKTTVDKFYMDKYLVTVGEFSAFVEETGFVTDAEKFGNSGVFNFEAGRWELLDGAYWRYPLGPDIEAATSDHPVTHVSWNDAQAFAEWVGKTLPHELQWEFAARNGKSDGPKYAWGDQVMMDGKFMANVWQGDLKTPQGADGFELTSPVGYYGETPAGLTDMGGNVWEWCENTYKPYPGSQQPFREDPNLKVIRGGSFFYDELGDNSFTVSFRNQNSRETSLFNTGFRCVLIVN